MPAPHSDRLGFWMMDNARAAEKLRYPEGDLLSVQPEFKRLRAETLALLRALSHSVWRPGGCTLSAAS